MIASGYTIHLYCDFVNQSHRHDRFSNPDEFFDESSRVAWKMAIASGWKFYERRTVAKCPLCVKMGIKERKEFRIESPTVTPNDDNED